MIEAGEETKVRPVPLGQGSLDYTTYLKLLGALQLDTPLVVPAQPSDEAYRRARDFLADAARKAGVSLA